MNCERCNGEKSIFVQMSVDSRVQCLCPDFAGTGTFEGAVALKLSGEFPKPPWSMP